MAVPMNATVSAAGEEDMLIDLDSTTMADYGFGVPINQLQPTSYPGI